MRRRYTIIVLLFIFVQVQAQTGGTLTVSVTTAQTATATFAPKNILAIWIEDNSGRFIKTLLAYANTRKAYLTKWGTSTSSAGSAWNIVDAVSGATQNSHGTRTCSWNGTDYTGKMVADGDYKLCMELTDQHTSTNFASFAISKGTSNQKLTPNDVLPSFKSLSIGWSALVTSVSAGLTQSNAVLVLPNPGNSVFNVLAEPVTQVDVYRISGEKVLSVTQPVFDLSHQPNGVYLVKIKSGKTTAVQKVIKN